jgi:hypothetical protein
VGLAAGLVTLLVGVLSHEVCSAVPSEAVVGGLAGCDLPLELCLDVGGRRLLCLSRKIVELRSGAETGLCLHLHLHGRGIGTCRGGHEISYSLRHLGERAGLRDLIKFGNGDLPPAADSLTDRRIGDWPGLVHWSPLSDGQAMCC